jgi:hypothetical protein
MTIRGFMRRQGIPVRHPGGRTPFMRRWRTGPEQSRDTSPGSAITSGLPATQTARQRRYGTTEENAP